MEIRGNLPSYVCSVHGEVGHFAVTFMVKDDTKPHGPYCLECLRIIAEKELEVCKEKNHVKG